MTRKTAQKKMYALITALLKSTDKIGEGQKATRKLKIHNGILESTGKPTPWSSYDEMIKAFEPTFKAMGLK
jgi:hypothetical protein